MHLVMRLFLVTLFIELFCIADTSGAVEYMFFQAVQDSVRPADSTPVKDSTAARADSINKMAPVDTNNIRKLSFVKNEISPEQSALLPRTSLQQMLKGKVPGLYVQEPSGEPGVQMSMLIRGTAIPYLSHADIYHAQPTIILDGIPLIMDDPFAFHVQQYDYNRMGPATNLLAAIDVNNIASIRVEKDLAKAAIYGPRAANGGVILIKTKSPVIGGRKILVNSYVGFTQKPNTYTTNGRFENDFRQPYYDRYAGLDEILNYPLYLRDSTNEAYYGPSNWTDLYYGNRVIRGLDASLSSGTERANFRFALGNQQAKNPADRTKLDRYNAMFEINMVPVTWLTISSMISATRLERQRNTYLRDRFATVQYLPDLENPISPNKSGYGGFLRQEEKAIDENKSNVITGYFRLKFAFAESFELESSFGFNYNEGLRDAFFPTTLMENVNYTTNYFGYSQRITFNNTLRFHHQWDDKHKLSVEAGEIFESDFNRYNLTYSYMGPNDLIKINELHSDPLKDDYLSSEAFPRELTFMFIDKLKHCLLSFYGKANYTYQNALSIQLLARADGSSSAQPDNWWFFAPAATVSWDLTHSVLDPDGFINNLTLHGSWGRVARLLTDDRFGEGPQYVSDLSFDNNPVKFSYNGFPGLSRPYSIGYIGYGVDWAYTDQTEVGVRADLFDSRIGFSLDVYDRVDKNMLMKVPSGSEFGYSGVYKNGLKVRNRGVDLALQFSTLSPAHAFQWSPSVNVNYNQNTLLALPDGLDELVIGSGISARKLKVGHAIDQFWLLKNKGIYNRERDIPIDPNTGKAMTFKGVVLHAGDPVWGDLNNDYLIDNSDKRMTGHYLPEVSGGFNNEFSYKNISLNVFFYYALGQRILNQDVANHLNFANREGEISMDAVKEITFWSKVGDYDRYPLYNPWSKAVPYRLDQDLFIEDGSFLKLRSVTLQYDFTGTRWWNKASTFKGLEVYVTGSNLFTVTPYTGGDPEIISWNGIDDGYGLPIPRTFTLGIKATF